MISIGFFLGVPAAGQRAPQAPKQGEEQQPFAGGLVELGGVAQLARGVHGEVHPPGHVRGATEELAVDEIADAAEGVPQGYRRGHEIGEVPEGQPPAAAVPVGGR